MGKLRIRQRLTRGIWKVTGWRFVGDPPTETAGIMIGAPHTSNWDYVAMLMINWHAGLTPKFLGKLELFKFPLGILTRATGGIPVDRANPYALVPELVRRVDAGEKFFLVIAAEGTRTKKKFWKSGFYRLAQQTGMPISLGFIDRASKTAGFGPTFHVTGNVAADMDILREFYADKGGVHPEKKTEPRFRDERGLAPVVADPVEPPDA